MAPRRHKGRKKRGKTAPYLHYGNLQNAKTRQRNKRLLRFIINIIMKSRGQPGFEMGVNKKKHTKKNEKDDKGELQNKIKRKWRSCIKEITCIRR